VGSCLQHVSPSVIRVAPDAIAVCRPLPTQHRAVVLLHRYFSRDSSVKCTGLDKWVRCSGLCFFA